MKKIIALATAVAMLAFPLSALAQPGDDTAADDEVMTQLADEDETIAEGQEFDNADENLTQAPEDETEAEVETESAAEDEIAVDPTEAPTEAQTEASTEDDEIEINVPESTFSAMDFIESLRDLEYNKETVCMAIFMLGFDEYFEGMTADEIYEQIFYDNQADTMEKFMYMLESMVTEFPETMAVQNETRIRVWLDSTLSVSGPYFTAIYGNDTNLLEQAATFDSSSNKNITFTPLDGFKITKIILQQGRYGADAFGDGLYEDISNSELPLDQFTQDDGSIVIKQADLLEDSKDTQFYDNNKRIIMVVSVDYADAPQPEFKDNRGDQPVEAATYAVTLNISQGSSIYSRSATGTVDNLNKNFNTFFNPTTAISKPKVSDTIYVVVDTSKITSANIAVEGEEPTETFEFNASTNHFEFSLKSKKQTITFNYKTNAAKITYDENGSNIASADVTWNYRIGNDSYNPPATLDYINSVIQTLPEGTTISMYPTLPSGLQAKSITLNGTEATGSASFLQLNNVLLSGKTNTLTLTVEATTPSPFFVPGTAGDAFFVVGVFNYQLLTDDAQRTLSVSYNYTVTSSTNANPATKSGSGEAGSEQLAKSEDGTYAYIGVDFVPKDKESFKHNYTVNVNAYVSQDGSVLQKGNFANRTVNVTKDSEN